MKFAFTFCIAVVTSYPYSGSEYLSGSGSGSYHSSSYYSGSYYPSGSGSFYSASYYPSGSGSYYSGSYYPSGSGSYYSGSYNPSETGSYYGWSLLKLLFLRAIFYCVWNSWWLVHIDSTSSFLLISINSDKQRITNDDLQKSADMI